MTNTFTPPRSLLSAFSSAYPGHSPDVFVRAPGCVSLLGSHVDIHGGFVITIGINREIWLAAAYGSADLLRLSAPDMQSSTTVSLKRLDDRTDIVSSPLHHCALYPVGVAFTLQQRGLKVNGIEAAFMGNIVMGAGLSSSAAVEVAFIVAWQALESWRLEPAELAQIGCNVEREFLGLSTGIQDQFTCLHARTGQILFLDCSTLEHEHITLPKAAGIVVCDTTIRRQPVNSNHCGSYANDCYAAAHIISLVDRHVKTLRDVSLERLNEFQAVLSESQYSRSHHVITEMIRVQQGAAALKAGDLEAFGSLMNTSYRSARDEYGSSSPSLDAMWQAATSHTACYGARYSGSGDSGSVVALVQADAIEDFIKRTDHCYAAATGQKGNLFPIEAVQGAGVCF